MSSDELLRYYDRELRFLRRLAADYAAERPKIATRLGIAGESVEDPHVRRLLEGVAYLNARVRRKLDDELPELSTALLGTLYPHFLAPIPSLSIVQFECIGDLGKAHEVPAGTALDSESVGDVACQFRTVYPTQVWPLRNTSTRLLATPFKAPATAVSDGAAAVLEIRLQCRAADMTFAQLRPGKLRFHINLPQSHHAAALFELLHSDALGLALASGPSDKAAVALGVDHIRTVGFERDEGLLPYPPQSNLGYRLLTEFFAFPAKFLFVEFAELPEEKLRTLERELCLYVYLRRTERDIESVLETDRTHNALALGCTPIVNLFNHAAEPIDWTRREVETRVVPSVRQKSAHEVYSVDRVTAVLAESRELPCLPFFGLDRLARDEQGHVWFHTARRASAEAEKAHSQSTRNAPTDVWLSLVEHGELANERDVALRVETTCTNRDLPQRLAFGGDRPRFTFRDGAGPIERVRCLRKPTDPIRPQLSDATLWGLVSHLTLNQISLGDPATATSALREILRLYDADGSPASNAVIEGLRNVATRRSALRVTIDGMPALVQGTQIELELDSDRLRNSGGYLFASVLERFFGLYAHINSFVQLTLRTSDRPGEVRRWLPRAGDRCLI